MSNNIKIGSILMQESTFLPYSLQFESQPYSNGWKIVRNLDGFGLEQKIRKAGWHFLYMAGEIEASAFGCDREKTLRKAVDQALAEVKSKRFNSVEITQMLEGRFLGLWQISVSAHARHVQESIFLQTG